MVRQRLPDQARDVPVVVVAKRRRRAVSPGGSFQNVLRVSRFKALTT
jgi:hypothetical protein